MKSVIFIASFFATSLAMAETATYNLTGLHCGGCKAAIEGSVCKEMKDASSCSVEVTNKKKQTGKLVITTKDGTTIEDAKIIDLVSKAGEYKAVRATSKK